MSRYCDCESGYAGIGCQRALQPLALNKTIRINLAPGGWAYYYVDLPMPLYAQTVNGELLVTIRRQADAARGVGGDPLLFVKPLGESAWDESGSWDASTQGWVPLLEGC